ncbi:MAG: hypothetical protein HN909_00755, partial [Phycisphaerales bacterium]|nr:hypothetical protein [Phycisphaerales bacterium]
AILMCLVLAASATAYAAPGMTYRDHLVYSHTSGNITVHATSPIEAEDAMRLFHSEFDRVRSEILHEDELKLTLPIKVFIWDDEILYHTKVEVAPDHGGACSFQVKTRKTKHHEIHLCPSALADQSYDEAVLNMLPHEICHILQYEQFQRDKLVAAKPKSKPRAKPVTATYPLAVAEGLAVLAEQSDQAMRIRLLGKTLRQTKGELATNLLQVTHYHQVSDMTQFYAEAYSFSEFLRSRMSEMQFTSFLELLRSGKTVPAAFGTTLGYKTTRAASKALNYHWRQHALLQAKLLAELEKRKASDAAKTDKDKKNEKATPLPPTQPQNAPLRRALAKSA